MIPIGRRRLCVAAGASLLATACKRSRAPEVAEVWDEQPGIEQTEALGSLAPPWPAPVRGRLGSGLLTFWLHEASSPAVHVRALLPTAAADVEPLRAAEVAIVTDHVDFELQRRLHRDGIVVRTEQGVDRVEISLHGREDDLPRMLQWLGWALRPTAPLAGMTRARDRMTGQLAPSSAEDLALAALVGRLLGRPAVDQRIQTQTLEDLSRADLERAWASMTDPRRAVLIVHAGRTAESAHAELRQLSDAWHGLGKIETVDQAVARLHVHVGGKPGTQRLLAEPASPLACIETGRGDPTLVAGRVIPTATADARSLARLAQRLVQEELDARLVVSGAHALFVVRSSLSRNASERSAELLVDGLHELSTTRHPAQRLFSAAQLWLGARVVEASLLGEDWTRLFAEAIDLADDDDAIAGALARDATMMLEPEPQVLRAWQERWLDPRGGEPGWHWVAAGADRKMQRHLERITPLRDLSAD